MIFDVTRMFHGPARALELLSPSSHLLSQGPQLYITNFDVQIYMFRPYCVVSIGGIVVIVRGIDFIELRHHDDSKPWPRGLASVGAIASLLTLP